MDLFDLLASTPPRGEHGESPQLTPVKLEGPHLTVDQDGVLHVDHFPNDVFDGQDELTMNSTDEQDDVFEPEHGPVLQKRRQHIRSQRAVLSIEQRLKKWGMDNKEFTVLGGSRLGCITCMKYGAWCEQEVADTKKTKKNEKKKKEPKKFKKKQVHTEEVKSPRMSHGPAEADSCAEATTHADIQHALQKGTYKPPAGQSFKYSLDRHLSGSLHQKATGARNEHVKYQDAPSDAQMMFVYDAVKQSPMVPPPPLPREYYGYYGLIARICFGHPVPP